MPYSSHNGKETICQWLDKNKSSLKTMVDFGAGAGAFGKMFKFLAPEIKRFAVEGYAPYVERFKLNQFYDGIIVGKIEEIKWPDGDVAIFGDVIEHLEKKQAIEIIKVAALRYKHLILSIPLGHCPQGASQGNELERHLSEWTFEELSKVQNWKIKKIETDIKDGFTIGVFIK